MNESNQNASSVSRNIWLRRSIRNNPCVSGKWEPQSIIALGYAAARETFTTSTQYFAGAWVNLFQSFLATSTELKWLDNGPGIGRDAKVAYSGLFGRYMARAFLMNKEGVRILVPLETARSEFQRNNTYRIGKKPKSNGLEADWIGLDDNGLVIAEAKGTFDQVKSSWHGNKSVPQLLRGAMDQAKRTKVYINSTGKQLPARYWAVASRWANEDNGVDPTTIAWRKGGGKLKSNDYQKLASILFRVDMDCLLRETGHPQIANLQRHYSGPTNRYDGDRHLVVGDQVLGPGFMTAVGPIESFPLRTIDDVTRLQQIRWMFGNRIPYIAIITLSSRYISNIARGQAEGISDAPSTIKINEIEEGLCIAKFSGLTVAWISPETIIRTVD